MLVLLHSDRLGLSHMTDKLVVLLDDPGLPSLGLIDNGLISNLVYLLILFEVIFFLVTAEGTNEKKKKKATLNSCSNSNLFALIFLFRLLFGFNLFVSPLNGLGITQGFLVQQVKG